MLINHLAFIDGIDFNVFFRGLLSVLVGVVVLIGGTYLLLATNTGIRSGFLIAMGALFGWMFAMGVVWLIYGIGWRGQPPEWELVEIVHASDSDGLQFAETEEAHVLAPIVFEVDEAGASELWDRIGDDKKFLEAQRNVLAGFEGSNVLRDDVDSDGDGTPDQSLDEAAAELDAILDDPARKAGLVQYTLDENDPDLDQQAVLAQSRTMEELDDWRYLDTANPGRGQAQAAADAFLLEEGVFEPGGYLPLQFGAFNSGGKPVLLDPDRAGAFDRFKHFFNIRLLHPINTEELMVIQVKAVQLQPVLAGEPPPVAAINEDAPLISVVMEMNRGGPFPAIISGTRFTPLMFVLFNGLVFGALAWNLHTRDKREEEIRAAVA